MEKAVVTVKGQIVIPARLRHRYGIKKGTKIAFMEKDGEIILKPIDQAYFKQFMGILPGKGKAVRALLKARQKEKERENKRAR